MNGEPPAEESDHAILREGEAERLKKVINGAVIAIESILMDDHYDIGAPANIILGRVSAALRSRLDDTLPAEVSGPYSNWTPSELRAEINALVASVERLEAERNHFVEINAMLRTRPDLNERAPLIVALAEERNLLRAVVRKLVRAADIEVADRIYFGAREFNSPNDLTPEELAAYRSAEPIELTGEGT